MCIYYVSKKNLNYNSEEHIFPAALGGKQTLLKGIVSDEFNNDISKIEQSFLRDSILNLPRVLLGPGKRGSLNYNKSTKSKIHLITSKENKHIFGLGYTELAKVYEIPNVKIDTEQNKIELSIGKMAETDFEYNEAVEVFLKKRIDSNKLRIKFNFDDDLPPNIILIGLKEGVEENYNCFVFQHSSSTFRVTKERLQFIGQTVNFNEQPTKNRDFMPLVHETANFKDDYFRVYGKIVFNYLAHKKGVDFVLKDCFDQFRNWIALGGNNFYAQIIIAEESPLSKLKIELPQDSHYILVTKTESKIVANVFLYNYFGVELTLSNIFTEPFNLDGFICDWKQRNEFGLWEFLEWSIKKGQAKS